MFRDIGHARISKDDERRGRGVGRQERDVRRTSAETGGQIQEMIVENDTPASRFSRREREKYNRILDLLRTGACDRLISYRLDRLTRIPRVLEDLIDLCEQRPFLVVNLHGTMDLTTAEGRKQARDRVNDAAYETDLMSERLRSAFEDKALRGEPHGNRAFGYACTNLRACEGESCCHAQPCEHTPRHKRCCRIPGCPHDADSIIGPEADAWRTGATDALAGEALQAIARRWNAAGLLTPNTYQPWDGTSVKHTLTNPRHAGLRHHKGELVGRGTWEPLIDEATHHRLVKLLWDPARGRRPSRRTPFTGLFTTPEGLALVRNAERGKPIYRHQNRPGRPEGTFVQINAEPLEEVTLEMLFGAVESGRVAERVAERAARASRPPAGEDPSVVQADLDQLAADKADPALGLSRGEWLAQRNVLLRRLEAAQAAVAAADPLDALAGVGVDIRARWALPEGEGGWSTDRKRAILRAVFERIVIHPVGKRRPVFDDDRIEPVWSA